MEMPCPKAEAFCIEFLADEPLHPVLCNMVVHVHIYIYIYISYILKTCVDIYIYRYTYMDAC